MGSYGLLDTAGVLHRRFVLLRRRMKLFVSTHELAWAIIDRVCSLEIKVVTSILP